MSGKGPERVWLAMGEETAPEPLPAPDAAKTPADAPSTEARSAKAPAVRTRRGQKKPAIAPLADFLLS